MERHSPRPGAGTRRRTSLTEADLELLRFLSEHRFVLADHAAALLGVKSDTAYRRLGRLVEAGHVRRDSILSGQPAMHLITRAGLAAAGSTLPPPRLDLHNYEHDVGLAWLWLAARRSTFGPLSEILGERRLRSHDAARDQDSDGAARTEPLGVRLGGVGARGRERLHYPDLLLTTADGRRVALELELSSKARVRLESILAAYGADPRIAGVVYLVQSRSVARSVEQAARRVGIEDLVHLQRVRLTTAMPKGGRGMSVARAAPHRRRAAGVAR